MAHLIENPKEISKDHYLMKIEIEGSSGPGQFVNIKIGDTSDPLIRRPFSIHDHNGSIIEIVFKIAGKGTKLLKEYKANTEIDIIPHLGKGFSIEDNKKVLLIGGGAGNAPLYYLSKELKDKNNEIHYLYASRSKEYIFLKEKYKAIADSFYLATDDGSDGEKGFADKMVKKILRNNKFQRAYMCGPPIMMKNIMNLIKDNNIKIEVSLETYFGCGIGLCSGCTVETDSGLARACVEGPVFDGRVVNWNSFC